MGPDRVSFLMEQFSIMDNEERFHLIEVMNNLLKVMTDMEASDIELGGYGTEDYVWFRIYGKKEPVMELPKFTHDESALIILSVLNDKQKKVLEEIRNLDFSYTFEYVNSHVCQEERRPCRNPFQRRCFFRRRLPCNEYAFYSARFSEHWINLNFLPMH